MLHGRKWSMNTSCIHSVIFFSVYYVLFQAMGIWWRREKSLLICLLLEQEEGLTQESFVSHHVESLMPDGAINYIGKHCTVLSRL